jgi:hypothetical protein
MANNSDSESTEADVAFALNPAEAYEGPIDYKTNRGRKMYETATSKLHEELYDCEAAGMYGFLKNVGERAHEQGWSHPDSGILNIPTVIEDYFQGHSNLLERYGEIEIDHIRMFETTYIKTSHRAAQDTHNMYKCLMKSLSKEGKEKINIWSHQYHIEDMKSGNLLLKVIIRESHLDTNATTSSIRTKLSNLDKLFPSLGYDVTKFNQNVKMLTDALKSRGHVTEDLFTNLMKGYLATNDPTLRDYATRKQERYEEGEEVTPDMLMQLMDNKFKSQQLHKEENAYAPPESDQISALTAQLAQLKKKNKKLVAAKKGPATVEKKKEPTKQGNSEPAWFGQKPTGPDLKKPKMWKDRPWYYCHEDTGGKCDGVWRAHMPSKCEGRAHVVKFKEDKKEDKRKVKLAQAYAAIAENDEDDMDETE